MIQSYKNQHQFFSIIYFPCHIFSCDVYVTINIYKISYLLVVAEIIFLMWPRFLSLLPCPGYYLKYLISCGMETTNKNELWDPSFCIVTTKPLDIISANHPIIAWIGPPLSFPNKFFPAWGLFLVVLFGGHDFVLHLTLFIFVLVKIPVEIPIHLRMIVPEIANVGSKLINELKKDKQMP